MFYFLVQDIVGWQLIQARSFTEAWAETMVRDTKLEDYYSIDRSHLQRRLLTEGWKTMSRSSEFPNVLRIQK